MFIIIFSIKLSDFTQWGQRFWLIHCCLEKYLAQDQRIFLEKLHQCIGEDFTVCHTCWSQRVHLALIKKLSYLRSQGRLKKGNLSS